MYQKIGKYHQMHSSDFAIFLENRGPCWLADPLWKYLTGAATLQRLEMVLSVMKLTKPNNIPKERRLRLKCKNKFLSNLNNVK